MKKMTLKEALEKMLSLANGKLAYAIEKNKTWDIEHYKMDIAFVKSELEVVNKS